ncbi:MAG: hypothetical protein J6N81_09460 [Treponema sp.]|nr:hypothetical protein [Treponema sp.]
MKKLSKELINIGMYDEFNLYEKQGSIRNYLVEEINYDREKLAEYLRNGRKLASCPREIYDCVRKDKISNDFLILTDETYCWINVLEHHILKYNLSLPIDFLEKAGCFTNKKNTPSEEELDDFRSYISSFSWRNAKTYEQFSPHEYILNFPCWKMKQDGKCPGESAENCKQCKEKREEFEKRVLFIRKYGERCKMLKTTYTVLCVDDRQYWTMGDPINTTWVLNRALINDPRRIPKLEWLDRILPTEG